MDIQSTTTHPIAEDMSLDTPEKEYVAPGPMFKGKELWPLTLGSELLFIQVRTPNQDTLAYEGLAFVYIHLKRGGTSFKEDRAIIAPMCWDIDRFHAAVTDWVESAQITAGDRLDAVRIYREAFEKAKANEVEPVGATVQKKTEEQAPTTSPSSSGSLGGS